MTPIEEWEALHNAVTDMVKIAEAAQERYPLVANLSNALGSQANPVTHFSATHGPAWALSAHREALERLNRHQPRDNGGCWHDDFAEWPTVWRNCSEVAGLRSVYMKGEQT